MKDTVWVVECMNASETPPYAMPCINSVTSQTPKHTNKSDGPCLGDMFSDDDNDDEDDISFPAADPRPLIALIAEEEDGEKETEEGPRTSIPDSMSVSPDVVSAAVSTSLRLSRSALSPAAGVARVVALVAAVATSSS